MRPAPRQGSRNAQCKKSAGITLFVRGRLSPAQFHEWFQESAGRKIPFDDLTRAASDIFWLNEPIVPVLDQLKAQGLRLVLLSNTCITHFEWVRDHYDVLQRFDACVTSCGAGAIKPEPAIYEAALREIGCDPGECFYTVDIPKYVTVGRQLGLMAEVFTDVPALRGHLRERGIAVS